MKLTIVFEDHRISANYANGVSKTVDFYTDHGDVFVGNTTTKTAFTDTVASVGHNMDDYWAIQYLGGQTEIEYANGHPNQVVSGNTGVSGYVSLMETWRSTIDAEEAQAEADRIEAERIAAIPTWDDVREKRDQKLLVSDRIIAWSTETGNAVPSDWTTYRQALRDLTDTYGAPTGNTELVVYPTEPSWPSA